MNNKLRKIKIGSSEIDKESNQNINDSDELVIEGSSKEVSLVSIPFLGGTRTGRFSARCSARCNVPKTNNHNYPYPNVKAGDDLKPKPGISINSDPNAKNEFKFIDGPITRAVYNFKRDESVLAFPDNGNLPNGTIVSVNMDIETLRTLQKLMKELEK